MKFRRPARRDDKGVTRRQLVIRLAFNRQGHGALFYQMKQDIAVMHGRNRLAALPFRHFDAGNAICAGSNAGVARNKPGNAPGTPFGL